VFKSALFTLSFHNLKLLSISTCFSSATNSQPVVFTNITWCQQKLIMRSSTVIVTKRQQ